MALRMILCLSFVIVACAQVKLPEVNIVLTGHGRTTLLFVHGWAISSTYWAPQVAAFKDDYRIVTVDLAGHGQSRVHRDDWSMDRYADDIVDVIKVLDLHNVVLIGHSMGGDVILHTLDKVPDRVVGFIAVDTFKELGEELNSAQQVRLDEFLAALRADYAAAAVSFSRQVLFSPTTDASVVNRVLGDVAHLDSAVSIRTLEAVFKEGANERTLASRMKIPMDLINSDETPTDEDALKKYCGASYRLHTVHGTGHYPMIERPDEFNKVLRETLNEIR